MSEEIIKQRRETHGDIRENAAISQTIKCAMRNSENYAMIPFIRREALDGIACKLARIAAGDPGFADHWDDIIGWALLGKHNGEPPPDA